MFPERMPVMRPATNPKLVPLFWPTVTAIKAIKIVTISGDTLNSVRWDKPSACTRETIKRIPI
jgi:hypothetical protein